ncbi:MAG TPA: 16S rRNA (cytosine(967)-C(5))-methyltransferase RsmB [Candidatus Hydrogenedentes bacterium]|jgi:16S rRNA (cytosine967-C5)-methyltransferase|nr:16S rRNA (cytosine(967)-C(5))-methyltransferase RsmB [Candidatus Hydrogenedentota bacterium]
MAVDPVRDAAVSVLLRVFQTEAHIDVSIDRALRRTNLSPRGARFMTHLVYGVVRHRLLCDHVLQPLCDQPLDQLPLSVLIVLRMGVFQSFFCSNVTRPALVHTGVDLAKKRSHSGLAKVANAVLRRLPSSLDEITLPDRTTQLMEHLRIRYSMPRWLVRLWCELYGEDGAEAYCAACDSAALPSVRINTLLAQTDDVLQQMQKAGIAAERITEALDALLLHDGTNPQATRWFRQGQLMQQDPASILAGALVDPKPGEKILDMCAAPGGKTLHLCALSRDAAPIFALERYAGRVARIVENRERLGGTQVLPLCGDGLQPPFQDGTFDRVLVDAPCSGLGTLRRHPEIKWRIQPETPSLLAATQKAMLRKALQLCKNGGLVVYSVCTPTPQETTEVTAAILAEGGCMPEDGPEQFDSWKTALGQYQTSPKNGAWDAFYLMRFRKQS